MLVQRSSCSVQAELCLQGVVIGGSRGSDAFQGDARAPVASCIAKKTLPDPPDPIADTVGEVQHGVDALSTRSRR